MPEADAATPEQAISGIWTPLTTALRNAPSDAARVDVNWRPDFALTYVNDAGERVHVILEIKRATTERLDGYRDALVDHLDAEVAQRLALLDTVGDGLDQFGTPAELARRMVAQLPLTPSPLEDLTGPFYDTTSLTKWLGVTRQALDARVRNRSLLGLPVQAGPRVYPAWQFAADKSTLPYLADLLKTLATGTSDPWTWALWLSAPSDAHDGLTAYEWLAGGRDPAQLLAEARADAARWAA